MTGISKALHDEFGEDYTYYTETKTQGFDKPCFFIALVNLTHTKSVGLIYNQHSSIEITYHPSSETPKAEIYDVCERLYWSLKSIQDDQGKIRGTKMRHQIIDNVLHFKIEYHTRVEQMTENTAMQTLRVESELN